MRVNIYGEELTDKVEIVKKAVNQKTFFGIRLYLKSHEDLYHSVDDNDESAITIWVPWNKKEGNDFEMVYKLFRTSLGKLEEVAYEEEQRLSTKQI